MMDSSMTRRDPSPDGLRARDPDAGAVDTFLERLQPMERPDLTYRVRLEIDELCSTDISDGELIHELLGLWHFVRRRITELEVGP